MAAFMNEKIAALKAYDPTKQKYKIKLDANESFVTLPAALKIKLASAALELDYNRYPDPDATAACMAFSRLHNVPLSGIVAGNGSDELIGVIIATFLQKGDKMITLTPDFSMYGFYAHIYEDQCIELKKDENFDIDLDTVAETANKESARLIIFSNPCNPTGRGFTRDRIERLVRNTQALVVIDEAYMEFWDQSVMDFTAKYPNVIVLKTCSKAIGLALVRLGFAVSSIEIIDVIKKAKSPFNVNGITQAFAATVLHNFRYISNAVESIIKSRDILYAGLKDLEQCAEGLKVFETSTNFVLVKVKKAFDIYNMLKDRGICVRFMMGEYLRITAGSQYENEEFLKAFGEILKAQNV